MYEAFFGLQRRPFAATPDPQCWYAGGPYQAALDELVVCAEQGQGIAMLVAPAGAGKTILCERLVRELSPRFDTVMLRHATFNTRRALLQTLLCEMQQPFDKPTDQELRLGLAPVLRRLHQLGRALVLIVDEAHLLTEALLEELRILSDSAQDGKPLVRLILVGQPGLEEKLVHPSMQALNHRIRAQIALSTLSRQETADYLDYRFTWAGGRTEELLTPEAIDMVCHAADGLPRCVNQLCDHALLLAFAAEKQPATTDHVLAALDDLKHLPLPWNPISEASSREAFVPEPEVMNESPVADHVCESSADEPILPETTAFMAMATPGDDAESMEDDEPTMPVYRLSAQLEAPSANAEEMVIFAAATPPAWNAGHVAGPTATTAVTPDIDGSEFVEEAVLDRYTALDAGLTPPELPPPAPMIEVPVELPVPTFAIRREEVAIPVFSDQEITWNAALARLSAASEVDEQLDAVQEALSAAQQADSEVLPDEELDSSRGSMDLADACPIGDRTVEDQLGTTVLEIMSDTRPNAEFSEPAAESSVFEFGSDDSPTAPTMKQHGPHTTPEPRRYRHLFTMLRRKQQGRG